MAVTVPRDRRDRVEAARKEQADPRYIRALPWLEPDLDGLDAQAGVPLHEVRERP